MAGRPGPAAEEAPYRKIAADLRQKIAVGELAEGDRLPSQPELMRQYGTTASTVGKAIALLASEGIITTRVGSGAYVRTFNRILRSSPQRLSASWWGSGHAIQDADTGRRPRSVGVEVGQVEVPERVAREMGLASGTPVIRRHRRFVVDDERSVQIATSWYPASIAMGTRIAQPDTGPGGAPARLADVGHAPVVHRERIRVRMPEPDERTQLELVPGTPVIQILRLSFDEAGQCVEATEMVLDGTAYDLEYVFPS
jgi:GntR family transcriptional regulator